jgi:hypothetical protein
LGHTKATTIVVRKSCLQIALMTMGNDAQQLLVGRSIQINQPFAYYMHGFEQVNSGESTD